MPGSVWIRLISCNNLRLEKPTKPCILLIYRAHGGSYAGPFPDCHSRMAKRHVYRTNHALNLSDSSNSCHSKVVVKEVVFFELFKTCLK